MTKADLERKISEIEKTLDAMIRISESHYVRALEEGNNHELMESDYLRGSAVAELRLAKWHLQELVSLKMHVIYDIDYFKVLEMMWEADTVDSPESPIKA